MANTQNLTDNSVGRLQELCQKKRWPMPNYRFLTYDGRFEAACYVANYCRNGNGRTKSKAKHMAADNMYKHLIESPLDSTKQVKKTQLKKLEEEITKKRKELDDLLEIHWNMLQPAMKAVMDAEEPQFYDDWEYDTFG